MSRKWLSEKKARSINSFLFTLGDDDRCALFGRRGNEYCMYRENLGHYRYVAVNITNAATIEFRMFASGGPAWACYCVRMVEYLINNAYTLNIDGVYAFLDSQKGM